MNIDHRQPHRPAGRPGSAWLLWSALATCLSGCPTTPRAPEPTPTNAPPEAVNLPDDIRRALADDELPTGVDVLAALNRAVSGHLTRYPSDAELNGLAGRLRLALGDPHGALTALARAENTPGAAEARLQACLTTGLTDACAGDVEAAPPPVPDLERHAMWSMMRAADGQAEAGAVHAAEMLDQHPGSIPLTVAAAWTALASGDAGRALLLAEMVLIAEPAPARWWRIRARRVYAQATLLNTPAAAAEALSAGAEVDPDVAASWVDYLVARGRPARAATAAREAVARFPASETLARRARTVETFARRVEAELATGDAGSTPATDTEAQEAP